MTNVVFGNPMPAGAPDDPHRHISIVPRNLENTVLTPSWSSCGPIRHRGSGAHVVPALRIGGLVLEAVWSHCDPSKAAGCRLGGDLLPAEVDVGDLAEISGATPPVRLCTLHCRSYNTAVWSWPGRSRAVSIGSAGLMLAMSLTRSNPPPSPPRTAARDSCGSGPMIGASSWRSSLPFYRGCTW